MPADGKCNKIVNSRKSSKIFILFVQQNSVFGLIENSFSSFKTPANFGAELKRLKRIFGAATAIQTAQPDRSNHLPNGENSLANELFLASVCRRKIAVRSSELYMSKIQMEPDC